MYFLCGRIKDSEIMGQVNVCLCVEGCWVHSINIWLTDVNMSNTNFIKILKESERRCESYDCWYVLQSWQLKKKNMLNWVDLKSWTSICLPHFIHYHASKIVQVFYVADDRCWERYCHQRQCLIPCHSSITTTNMWVCSFFI